MSSTTLDRKFLDHLVAIHSRQSSGAGRLKWYITAVISLAGMNYAELIPELYTTLLSSYIPIQDHVNETRKIREALTKVCGIWGAAKVCRAHPFEPFCTCLGPEGSFTD